jgi:hypothetical protein
VIKCHIRHNSSSNYSTVNILWRNKQHRIHVTQRSDCMGSCKSNYHAIMTTTSPYNVYKNYLRLRLPQKVFILQPRSSYLTFIFLFSRFHFDDLQLPMQSLKLWVRITLRRGVLNTTLCDKACQWLTEGRWFYPGTPISSINKIDHHDIVERLLKVALNTIALTPKLFGGYSCKLWSSVIFKCVQNHSISQDIIMSSTNLMKLSLCALLCVALGYFL